MKPVCVISSRTDIIERVRTFVADGRLPARDYVFVIEYFAEDLPPSEPGACRVKDFSDAESLKLVHEWVLCQGPFAAVISADEFAVHLAGRIRDELKISGLSQEQSRKYRDKAVMRAIAAPANLRVPRHYNAATVLNAEFPVILKPRALAGSVGVEIASSLKDFWERIQGRELEGPSFTDMSPNQYICQEFIRQPLYHVELVVRRGMIVFAAVSKYADAPVRFLTGTPVISQILYDVDLPPEWSKFLTDINTAFALENGVYHLEAFHAPGEPPIFLELGFRPGGGLIVPLIEALYGIDLLAIHLSLQLNPDADFRVNKTQPSGGFLIFPKFHASKENLKVTSAYLPPEPCRSKLIYKRLPKPGDPASGVFFCHEDALGSFALIGSAETVAQDLSALANGYRVLTEVN